ncbi:hypothetical protein NC651_024054 [Populus alba x Populus x berolinensis]|nr:hypothetical protein NC651_024054 [Populus alba x Populus x berolinensis]
MTTQDSLRHQLYDDIRLAKYESYQKYSNGNERWTRGCQTGRNLTRSI